MRQEVHLVPPLFFALLLSGCASTGPSNLEGATTIEPVECIRPSHISGSQPPPRPIDPALWGPLADLAGLNWLWFFDKNAEINRFDVIDNGNSIRYAWRSSTLDGCMRVVVFHEPESPGVWRADINDWGGKEAKGNLSTDENEYAAIG